MQTTNRYQCLWYGANCKPIRSLQRLIIPFLPADGLQQYHRLQRRDIRPRHVHHDRQRHNVHHEALPSVRVLPSTWPPPRPLRLQRVCAVVTRPERSPTSPIGGSLVHHKELFCSAPPKQLRILPTGKGVFRRDNHSDVSVHFFIALLLSSAS